MRNIYGWVDSIDFKHNNCSVFLIEHPKSKDSKVYEYSLDARWLWRNGIQRANQPFVLKQYFEGNQHICEIKALCDKDDFETVNLLDIFPDLKEKYEKLMKLLEKEKK